jgi:hypothetical protein
MSPVLLFPLGLIVPVVIAAAALVPFYAGFAAALYVIYLKPDGSSPLEAHLFDVFYVFESYAKLFQYWLNHMGEASFVEFTLPLLGLPILGISLAIYLTLKLVQFFVNFFRMAAPL